MPTADTFEIVCTRAGLDGVEGPTDRTIRPGADAPTATVDLPHITIDGEQVRGADLKLRGVLGQGGMGVVHLARQSSLDRDVAVKRVRDDAPPRAAEGLLREARFMGRLEHPNIVPVHALGQDADGRPVLVMKKVDGLSWRTVIRDSEHPWWRGDGVVDRLARHVEILCDVCQAAHFAHAQGVLHRDLKPDNVMLGGFGEVYLVDWGVATRLDAPERGVVGTPAYMAPEMLDPARPPTVATDVFLLGACLHEALTGRPPHDGEDLQATLRAVHAWAGPRLGAEVPAELARVCERACAADPAERFASAAELRLALMACLRGRAADALANAATLRLERLRRAIGGAADDRTQVDALFTECRFGFREALAIAPDDPAAASGLRDALAAMIPFELSRGGVDGAAALLQDLERHAPGEDHAALRAAVDETRAHQERLRALVQDLDPAIGSRERTRFVLGLLAMISVVTVYVLFVSDASTYDHVAAVRLMVVMDLVVAVGIALGWRWIRSSAVNRGLVYLAGAAGLLVLSNRLMAWRLDTPVPAMLATDLLLIGMAVAASAVITWRRAAVASLVYFAGAALIALRPEAAIVAFGPVSMLGMIALASLAWTAQPGASE